MAVGNPLGLASTVTTGIVSAIDRPVSTSGENGGDATVTNAIQVDAAVNPGNSGGPLFDASGRVIGINSSIATLSQESGSIGLGFAIPVDLVKNVAAQLIEDGSAEHAFLGVSLSDGTATADDVTRRGAVVESVSDGSPAAEGGHQGRGHDRRDRRQGRGRCRVPHGVRPGAPGRHQGHADGRPRRQDVGGRRHARGAARVGGLVERQRRERHGDEDEQAPDQQAPDQQAPDQGRATAATRAAPTASPAA